MLSIGAAVLHLSPWLGVQVAQGPEMSRALAAHKSVADIAAMNMPTDKGALFLLAVAIAILSAGVLFVERAKIQAAARGKVKKPIGAFA